VTKDREPSGVRYLLASSGSVFSMKRSETSLPVLVKPQAMRSFCR